MAKHMKRYRREQEKNSVDIVTKGGQGTATVATDFDMIPSTFVLPSDYNMFVDEFRKSGPSMWIVKPCGKGKQIAVTTS